MRRAVSSHQGTGRQIFGIFSGMQLTVRRPSPAFELAYRMLRLLSCITWNTITAGAPSLLPRTARVPRMPKRLLKELFDGKPLQKQLVAAYTIGMAVEPDLFTSIKPCNTPDQTGCCYQLAYLPERL